MMSLRDEVRNRRIFGAARSPFNTDWYNVYGVFQSTSRYDAAITLPVTIIRSTNLHAQEKLFGLLFETEQRKEG